MNDFSNLEENPKTVKKAVGPVLLIAFTFFPLVVIALMVAFLDLKQIARRMIRDPKLDQASAQVARVVTDLDQRTSETGVYQKAELQEAQETDPWGNPLEVGYSQGGIAETVTVRSAGPDGAYYTQDDIVASGISANFKGIGNGIKLNAQATSSNVAKGLVKGAVEGVKESIKESLPFRKKAAAVEPAPLPEAQPAS